MSICALGIDWPVSGHLLLLSNQQYWHEPSVWQRIGRVASWAKSTWNSISASFIEGAGLRVSLVVVFDELE